MEAHTFSALTIHTHKPYFYRVLLHSTSKSLQVMKQEFSLMHSGTFACTNHVGKPCCKETLSGEHMRSDLCSRIQPP